MTALAEPIVDTVIPDGFEPVEAYRCWELRRGKLCSLNSVAWRPGKAVAGRGGRL